MTASTLTDLDIARTLFREYATELGVDLCFQGFQEELAGLPGKYGPPTGRLLLAFADSPGVAESPPPVADALGCVALRPLSADTCEMKRLYVRAAARRTGLGRTLVSAILAAGRALGYRRMVLDTLAHMTPALTLYRAFGFRETESYYHNPLPDVVYLAREL